MNARQIKAELSRLEEFYTSAPLKSHMMTYSERAPKGEAHTQDANTAMCVNAAQKLETHHESSIDE